MKLTQNLIMEMKLYAASQLPNEACGFLIEKGKSIQFYPCKNNADRPSETFMISADDWIDAEAIGKVVAIVHSHPNGDPYLSGADRQMQVQTALPWVLLTSEEVKVFEPVPHLRGRLFDYGVFDCYTLIKDAYHLAGVNLSDYLRGDIDADAEANRYVEHLPDEGFEQVGLENIRAGDIVLTALGGNANHALFYLGNQEVVHHAYEQLSRKGFMHRYWLERVHSVWRHKDWRPEMIEAVVNDLEHSNQSW